MPIKTTSVLYSSRVVALEYLHILHTLSEALVNIHFQLFACYFLHAKMRLVLPVTLGAFIGRLLSAWCILSFGDDNEWNRRDQKQRGATALGSRDVNVCRYCLRMQVPLVTLKIESC